MSLDSLEDNNLIHQFATAYREPQQQQDDDDDDDDDDETEAVQEEEEEHDEEDDIVPVTGGQRPWKSDEEVALTNAFLHIFENRKHSNEQRRDLFWRRIIAHFSKLPGSTDRNMDQMTSKWGDLNRKMSKFNACFIQLTRQPQSEASESTLIQNALKDYCATYRHKSFPHLAAWEVARHHPKWEPVTLVDMDGPTAPRKKGGSKRSKTSESGNYTTSTDGLSSNMPKMNLNEEPDDDTELDDTPTRPQRKKSGESSSKGKEAVADYISEYKSARFMEMAEAKERKEKLAASKLRRDEAYIKHLSENEKNSDLNVLLQLHDTLDEHTRSIPLQRKREICEKWGWAMP